MTEVSYGQDVHRRIGTAVWLAGISLGIGAMAAFSKSKKHYSGLTWHDAGKKGGIALQADKNEYRGLMAGIEPSATAILPRENHFVTLILLKKKWGHT